MSEISWNTTLAAETGYVRIMVEKHISIPKPFCMGDISEWFLKFEICCKANNWNDKTKSVKLHTLLEGEALTGIERGGPVRLQEG